MNDENEEQKNSTVTSGSQYIPSIYAIDGSCIDEKVNNSNINFYNIEGDYYKQLQNINKDSKNNVVIGFSAGGKPAVEATAYAINNNGISVESVFVIDDGTAHVDSKKYRNSLQTLAASNSEIYFISRRNDNSNYTNLKADAEEYAKTAGTAFLITNNGTKGHGTGAEQIYARTVNDNLVGYLNGSGQLTNTEDYTFEIFDSATNTWSTYNYDEFQSKVKAGEIKLSGNAISQTVGVDSIYTPIGFSAEEIVQSDKQELLTYLNDIRKNLTLAVSVNSYNSSTAIPNSESDAVQEFFEGTQRLFQVIDADTKFILSAATSLEDLDTLLANKASTLGGSSTLGNIITGVTTSIGAALGMLFMGVPGAASGALLGNKVGSLIGQFFGLDTSSKTVEVNTNVTSVDLSSRKGITANTKSTDSSTTTATTGQIISPNIIPVDPDTILKTKTTSTTETPEKTKTIIDPLNP